MESSGSPKIPDRQGRDARHPRPPLWLTKTNKRVELKLKCCFTSTETVGLLGTGTQDVHLDFHTAPELCKRVEAKGGFLVDCGR